MYRPNIEVKDIAWHRNGISGAGFHVVLFTDDGRNMMGIVFEEHSYVAVLDTDLLAKGDIGVKFEDNNSWRGDVFEPSLRQAVREYTARIHYTPLEGEA